MKAMTLAEAQISRDVYQAALRIDAWAAPLRTVLREYLNQTGKGQRKRGHHLAVMTPGLRSGLR